MAEADKQQINHMMVTSNSTPKFLLIWLQKNIRSAESASLDRNLVEAPLDLPLALGSSLLHLSSSFSSQSVNLDVRSSSSNAPLVRVMSALVRPSATIRG